MFKEPVEILPNTSYIASAKLKVFIDLRPLWRSVSGPIVEWMDADSIPTKSNDCI